MLADHSGLLFTSSYILISQFLLIYVLPDGPWIYL